MVVRSAIVLVCLAALSATANSANVETKYIEKGENLKIGESHSYNNNVESCIIHTNNGSTYTLYPSNNYPSRFSFDRYDMCKTAIYRMTENDTGIWKMSMTLKGKVPIESVYEVKVRQEIAKKAVYPSSSIKVFKNQFVSVHFFDKFENLEYCKIIDPQNKEYDLASNKSSNIKLYNGCGVKIGIPNDDDKSKHYSGTWTLIADLKNGTTFYAPFNVLVRNITDLKPQENTFIFKRGEEGIITFGPVQEEKLQMCILQNPQGVKMPITPGPCKHQIKKTSEHHEGIWTAHYGIEGSETLVQQKITVKTYSESNFNSSITTSANGDVHILCQVRAHSMKFCTFERPDGLLIHMSNGVGNERYEYYGNGVTNEEYYLMALSRAVYDCGITIHKPNIADYGSWKCLIGVKQQNGIDDIVGKILKVASGKSSATIESTKTSKDVYAKRGAQFKIKCSTNEQLSYCWLRSPNGTVHSVVTEKNPQPPALKYVGTSFDLGDCTAAVENANDTDAGKWTCHMGVANGPELETSFNVHLEETYLKADQDLVVLDKSQADLICRPLPDSGKVIESCRWVNPAGHGINVDPSGRYITQTETTHCRLSFRVVNLKEDLGEWSCFAQFAEEENREGSARMLVVYHDSSSLTTFLTVALVISLVACIALGIFVLLLYKRRVALRHIDEKIILDEKPPKYP